MNILLYCNCQADGVLHFLEKTPFGQTNAFKVFHNFRLILMEQDRDEFYKSLQQADLIIYQPTLPLDCRDGHQIPDSDALFAKYVRPEVPRISFAYQFQSGFFPILKVAPGFEGWITGNEVRRDVRGGGQRELMQRFDFDFLRYDCARRFIECLAEQSRREQTCDVKMVDWILANYQTQRLFLTQNHPASALFAELTKRIMEKISIDYAWLNIPFDGINDAQLPGTMPVHPAVVRELGLKYPADQDQSVFRTLLEQFVANPNL